MKTPIVYEIAGQLRCLLVVDGQKISIGRAADCDVQINGAAVGEIEATVQFVNDCQSVLIDSGKGSAPNEQPLPWTFPLAGFDLVLYRPFSPADVPKTTREREVTLQGLTDGKACHVLMTNQPMLLGCSDDCDLVIPSADCAEVQLALWAAADNKVAVQVLDNSCVVDWLGRADATKAEMELPFILSLGGKMIFIDDGALFCSNQISAPLLTPSRPLTLAKALPSPVVTDEFYVNKSSQPHGPLSEEEVRCSVRCGTSSSKDISLKEGAEDSSPLNNLNGISDLSCILPPPAEGGLSIASKDLTSMAVPTAVVTPMVERIGASRSPGLQISDRRPPCLDLDLQLPKIQMPPPPHIPPLNVPAFTFDITFHSHRTP